MFNSEIIVPIIENIKNHGNNHAFCINNCFYSYKQFGEAICKVRSAIKKQYTEKNSNVGLVINDDIETYASILALWLEGLAYVPLHPNWPIERCKDIINQVGIKLILDSSITTRYKENDLCVINTTKLDNIQIDYCVNKEISNDINAYILFTSGSTGRPKGVQISRANIASFIRSFWETGISLKQEERCLQCFDLTFDVSVQCFLASLIKGACCYTIPLDKIKYIYASYLIEEHKLSFCVMPPSMIRYLRPYYREINLTSIQTCILTAEACTIDLIDELFQNAKNAEIYNFYGPTETTIYCTYYKLSRGGHNKTLNGIISIGQPMKNVVAIIIDEHGQEVENGEKGELCIAGRQVTCGYINNLNKNNDSFFIKKYMGSKLRFYHTGDLCFMDKDGDIMYSGRLDHQAKIQGFRVEMSEIEFHARQFVQKNTIAIAIENKLGITEIALFIENSKEIETKPLIDYLRTKLPNYMIPSHYYFIQTFPLNDNGKIDKCLLKSKISI